MFIEAKFRRLMLEMPEVVRKSMLSDHEIKICKYAHDTGIVTSRDTANRFNLSVQNAGIVLTKLVRKGYLLRTCLNDPTGGKIFEYKAAFAKNEGDSEFPRHSESEQEQWLADNRAVVKRDAPYEWRVYVGGFNSSRHGKTRSEAINNAINGK